MACCKCAPDWFSVPALVFFIMGSLLLIFGFVSEVGINKLLDQQIDATLVMTDTQSQYYTSQWQHNDATNDGNCVPMYKHYSIFNITNPAEVVAGLQPIALQEVGPYLYRENKIRVDTIFISDTLAYKEYLYYTYENTSLAQALRLNPDTDMVTVPNLALITLFKMFNDSKYSKYIDEVVNFIRREKHYPGIFINLRVSDIIWGYEDPLLSFIHNLTGLISPLVPGLDSNATRADAEKMNANIINTGKDDIDLILSFESWLGQTSVESLWEQPEPVGGTDASQFKRNVDRIQTLYVWFDQAFRKAPLVYTEDVTIAGLSCYRFRLDNSTMMNSSQNPNNAKYYQNGPSGVCNLTKAEGGTPIFLSKPHFLDADPSYRLPFSGLFPFRDQHDTIVDVEPLTGATMNAHKRIQVNVQVAPISALKEYDNLPSVLFPMGWVEESATIPQNLADQINSQVYGTLKITQYLKWGCLAGSISFFVLCFTFALVKYLRFRQLQKFGGGGEEAAGLLQ